MDLLIALTALYLFFANGDSKQEDDTISINNTKYKKSDFTNEVTQTYVNENGTTTVTKHDNGTFTIQTDSNNNDVNQSQKIVIKC